MALRVSNTQKRKLVDQGEAASHQECPLPMGSLGSGQHGSESWSPVWLQQWRSHRALARRHPSSLPSHPNRTVLPPLSGSNASGACIVTICPTPGCIQAQWKMVDVTLGRVTVGVGVSLNPARGRNCTHPSPRPTSSRTADAASRLMVRSPRPSADIAPRLRPSPHDRPSSRRQRNGIHESPRAWWKIQMYVRVTLFVRLRVLARTADHNSQTVVATGTGSSEIRY